MHISQDSQVFIPVLVRTLFVMNFKSIYGENSKEGKLIDGPMLHEIKLYNELMMLPCSVTANKRRIYVLRHA